MRREIPESEVVTSDETGGELDEKRSKKSEDKSETGK